jgi:pyruvyltransferase
MRRKIAHFCRRLLGVNPPAAMRDGPGFPQVELVSWRPADGTLNFGDALSGVVVSRVLGAAGLDAGEQVPVARRMLAIGSVMHFARDGDAVWGSGVNGKVPVELHRFSRLDVRAVRGPRTRDFLRARGIAVPEIYGDPALLVPALFPGRFVRSVAERVVIVPNLHDLARFAGDPRVVSPLLGWNEVVRRIVGAERVLSTSLHGIVLADAFGVPVNYLRVSENEGTFKYEDHMLATGRSCLRCSATVEEALAADPLDAARLDVGPLLRAFPYDLWTGAPSAPGVRAP